MDIADAQIAGDGHRPCIELIIGADIGGGDLFRHDEGRAQVAIGQRLCLDGGREEIADIGRRRRDQPVAEGIARHTRQEVVIGQLLIGTRTQRGERRARRRVDDEVAAEIVALAPVIFAARGQLRQEAVEIMADVEPRIEIPVLAVLGRDVERIQPVIGRVGDVDRRGEGRHVLIARRRIIAERAGEEGAAAHRAGLVIGVIAVRGRPVDVGGDVPAIWVPGLLQPDGQQVVAVEAVFARRHEAGIGDGRLGDRVADHGIAGLQHRAAIVRIDVEAELVISDVQARRDHVQSRLEFGRGLPLGRNDARDALAILGLDGGAGAGRRIEAGGRAARLRRGIAVQQPAEVHEAVVADRLAPILRARQDAEGAVAVFRAGQHGDVGAHLLGLAGIGAAHVDGGLVADLQRAEGLHVDIAAQRAFAHVGGRGLHHVDARGEFGGQHLEAELATGRAAILDQVVQRDGAAVHQRVLELRPQATDADIEPLAARAGDRHAGDQLQRLGDILGRELADIGRADGIDAVGGTALGLDARRQAARIGAVDDDIFALGARVTCLRGLRRSGGGACLLRVGGQRAGHQNKRNRCLQQATKRQHVVIPPSAVLPVRRGR